MVSKQPADPVQLHNPYGPLPDPPRWELADTFGGRPLPDEVFWTRLWLADGASEAKCLYCLTLGCGIGIGEAQRVIEAAKQPPRERSGYEINARMMRQLERAANEKRAKAGNG